MNIKSIFATILVATLTVTTSIVNAQDLSLANDPEVKYGRLENGLTYYIRHNNLPEGRAEFHLITNAGAIQEGEGQDGLAHFLEHMCFNGLKNLPGKQMLEYLQDIGAEFGRNINAGTSVEQTVYMLNNIPVSREGIVDTCLLVLHDWSHFVTCDPKEIEDERGVILEEKRTRNDAGWRVFEQSLPYYFGDGNKYSTCNIIGSENTLKTFSRDTLVDFYHKWYRPDLQAVIIVGDIDPEAVHGKLEKLFADIPATANPAPREMPTLELNDSTVVGILTDKELSRTSVEFVWKIGEPAPKELNATPVGYFMHLVKLCISSIMSERFNEMALSPDCPFDRAGFGVGELCERCEAFNGEVNCENNKCLEACRAFLTEIERMRRYGFSEDEVERVKANILKGLKDNVDGAETRKNASFVEEYKNNFFGKWPYMTPADEYAAAEKLCAAITAESLNKHIMRTFTGKHLTIIYTGPDKDGMVTPSKEELLGVVDETGRAQIESRIGAGVGTDIMAGIKLRKGKIKNDGDGLYGSRVWTLSNNLKVVAMPTKYKKNQVIALLRRQGGRNIVPTEDLASFDNTIFKSYNSNKGIGKYSSSTIEKMLSGKSVSFSPYITNYYNGIQGSCATSDIETLLQLMCLEYNVPRYEKDEWEVSMKQMRSVIPNLTGTPKYVFSKHFYKNVYDNPRMTPISMEKLDAASLETFSKYYGRMFDGLNGAVLYLVGDFDAATVKPLVEKYLGSIKKGQGAPALDEGNIIRFKEGSASDVFHTKMTTPKVSADFVWSVDTQYSIRKEVDLTAADFILNMMFTETLREKESGTYGASCNISLDYWPYEHATIQVDFSTNVEQQEKLRTLAVKCIRELVDNGPDEEHLQRAIENARKVLPENRISNVWWRDALIGSTELKLDYDKEYGQAIEGITAEGIQKALKEIIDAGNMRETVMLPQ